MTPGTVVTYRIKVAEMDPTFRVWDIHVKTNPFALNPTNFTIIPNTLEANASITELEISHCVNGRG